MSEEMARRILEAAIREGRCAEFMDCLFDGGSATVDARGLLACINSGAVHRADREPTMRPDEFALWESYRGSPAAEAFKRAATERDEARLQVQRLSDIQQCLTGEWPDCNVKGCGQPCAPAEIKAVKQENN